VVVEMLLKHKLFEIDELLQIIELKQIDEQLVTDDDQQVIIDDELDL
jgi:hypothetical protein